MVRGNKITVYSSHFVHNKLRKGIKMSIKKVLLAGMLIFSTLFISGCGSSGSPQVLNMNDSGKFVIGKTTISDVEKQLGGTMFMFDKADGVKKYVYTAKKRGIFKIGRKYRTLALYFDKNSILTKEELHTEMRYTDPDIMHIGAGAFFK